jgi:DNA-binding NarL/FixJ family response regulator
VRARTGFVVVADGNSTARQLAVDALQRAGYETVEAESGVEALAAARAEGAALVLLEVDLPVLTGYEVCHTLRQEAGEELPIFFVSGSRSEPLDRVAALLLGADDFIVKPFDPSELVARVGRFVSRRPAVDAKVRARTELPHLTQREREVLALLAAGARQAEVAQRLSISPRTVATHIQNLFGKLGVNSRAQLVAAANLLGLVVRS